MNTADLVLKDTLFEACVEHINECEAIIPDYYPEIFRVVRAQAQPLIQKASLINGRITLQGQILYSILYLPSDGKGLCSFSKKEPFSCTYNSDAEGLYIGTAKAQYVGCKLIAPRKAVLKAVLGVSLKVEGKNEKKITPLADKSIIALNRKISISRPVSQGEKLFKITDEQEIKDNVGAPIYTDVMPILKETKILKGKLIITGEMLIKTLYVNCNDEIKESFQSFVFSQIMDVQGASEGDSVECYITVCDIESKLAHGDKEGLSVIEYDITALLQVLVCKDEETQIIADCFCIDNETELKKERAVFIKNCGKVEGTVKISSALQFPDGINYPVDAGGVVRTDTCTHSGRLLRITGSIELQLLYFNSENELQSAQRQIPFEAEYATDELNNITCRPYCLLTGCTVSPVSENEAKLSLSVYTRGLLEEKITGEYVSSLKILTESPRKGKALPPLSLYFARKNESLWDIAKQFNVSPQRIKDLNNCGDILETDVSLLLPRIM